MSETPFAWPALKDLHMPSITYDQAVWGKTRGSGDDFQWIARSEAFASGDPPIEDRLKFGSEDRLVSAASFWKVTNTQCFAIRAYKSPVADATGERGLEKHFICCRRIAPRPTPTAAVAAALLLESSRLVGSLDVHDASHTRDRRLPKGTVELRPALDTVIQTGIAQLRQTFDAEALTNFYWQILGRVRPAVLRTTAPLSPEAMAALLLPLERTVVDTLSIAGWIPSTRFNAEAIRSEWDAVICDMPARELTEAVPDPALQARAKSLFTMLVSRAIMSGAPPSQAGATTPAVSTVEKRVAPALPDFLVLLEFARSKERYRRFRKVAHAAEIDEEMCREIQAALKQMKSELYEDELDHDLLDARRRHLQLKANRLRDMAVQINPTFGQLNWTIE